MLHVLKNKIAFLLMNKEKKVEYKKMFGKTDKINFLISLSTFFAKPKKWSKRNSIIENNTDFHMNRYKDFMDYSPETKFCLLNLKDREY